VITKVRRLSPSWAKTIQSTSSHPTSLWWSLILSFYLQLGLTSGLFYFTCPWSPCMHSVLPTTCYVPRPSHLLRFYLPSYIWSGKQILQLLNKLFFFFFSFYSILGQIIIFSSAPFSPTPATFPQCDRPSHTSIQKTGKITVLYILVIMFFSSKCDDKIHIPDQTAGNIPIIQRVLNIPGM
jgi:hypothetical protein